MIEIKQGSVVDGKKVEKVLKFKVYYDTERGNVIGNMPKDGQPPGLIIKDLDQDMPVFTNMPQWWEEREAVMLVFESKK